MNDSSRADDDLTRRLNHNFHLMFFHHMASNFCLRSRGVVHSRLATNHKGGRRPISVGSIGRGGLKILNCPLKNISIIPKTAMSSRRKHLYEFGPYRLDVVERILLREGKDLQLTPKGFELLLTLVRN